MLKVCGRHPKGLCYVVGAWQQMPHLVTTRVATICNQLDLVHQRRQNVKRVLVQGMHISGDYRWLVYTVYVDSFENTSNLQHRRMNIYTMV